MHALRPVSADLSHLQVHAPRAAFPARSDRPDAGHRRRPPARHQDVCRRNVPSQCLRMPRVHDRVSGGVNYAELFEQARAEAEQSSVCVPKTFPPSPHHPRLAVRGPPTAAGAWEEAIGWWQSLRASVAAPSQRTPPTPAEAPGELEAMTLRVEGSPFGGPHSARPASPGSPEIPGGPAHGMRPGI